MVEKRDEIIGKDMEVIQPYFNIIRIFIGKLIVEVRCSLAAARLYRVATCLKSTQYPIILFHLYHLSIQPPQS